MSLTHSNTKKFFPHKQCTNSSIAELVKMDFATFGFRPVHCHIQ